MHRVRALVLVAASAAWACLTSDQGSIEAASTPTPDGGPASEDASPGRSDAAVPDAGSEASPGIDPGKCTPLDKGATMPISIGGSRLRPVAWTSADGLDVAAGIHDLLADVDCTPVTGVGCRPDAEPLTQLVARTAACNEEALAGGPGLANRVIRIANTDELVWTGAEIVPASDVCAFAVGTKPYAQHVYAITKRAPLAKVGIDELRCVDTFVDAFLNRTPDGAQLFTGLLFDHAHLAAPFGPSYGDALGAAADGTGADRWLPGSQIVDCSADGYEWFFDINQHIAVADGAVHFLVADSTTHCPSGVWPPPADPTRVGYRVGGTIPFVEFEDASFVDIGGTRLRANVRSLGGRPLEASATIGPIHTMNDADVSARIRVTRRPEIRDLDLGGLPCRPERASDGVVRCLPPDSDQWSLLGPPGPPPADPNPQQAQFIAYTDASCTNPIAVIERWPKSPPVPTMMRQHRSMLGTCSSAVYSVGTSIPVPNQLYGRFTDSGDCAVCSDISGYPTKVTVDAYAITGEVAPATFAPMTIEVR
jgi:hypothetical protein